MFNIIVPSLDLVHKKIFINFTVFVGYYNHVFISGRFKYIGISYYSYYYSVWAYIILPKFQLIQIVK